MGSLHARRPLFLPPARAGRTPLTLTLLIIVGLMALAACAHGRFTGDGGSWLDAPALDLWVDAEGGLPPSVEVTRGDEAGVFRVTFSLDSTHRGERCSVAGEFNDWNADEHPLERTADGRWRGEVLLHAGAWRYKFCLDGSRWFPDPENPEKEDDGFASENSILRLGALGHPEELEGGVGDGSIETAALEHDPSIPLYLHRLRRDRVDMVRIRYRTLARDVEGVTLHARVSGQSLAMVPVLSPAPFQYWQVDVAAADDTYAFTLRDGERVVRDPREFDLRPAELACPESPDWAKEAIWYQIFPERFRNGNRDNDPADVREWTSDWNEPAPFEGRDGQTFWEFYVYSRMYGGDLQGIEEALDHLEDLGVNALYLNPVFQAEGPHKYNATDFRHIDTGFGAGEDFGEATRDERIDDPSTWTFTPSDRLFLDFLKTVKGRGFRVVLDAVFNHVGVLHPAFRDLQERGAESPFSDWFQVESFEPFRYHGWAGFGELPVFAKDGEGFAAEGVKEHVFAVTRRWMDPDGDGDPSDGIDGWRLDVPGEVPRPFWEEWRALVKGINPDAVIIGEIWGRADRWLDGRTFDSVMNYRFAEPVISWIGDVEKRITATELDRRLLELRLAYPAESSFAMMNLVNSHDTDRLASMLLNPDRPYDRSNQIQRDDSYNSGRPDPVHFQKARLVALFQMTYVGAPMVFYGDEVGMWGADDPTNRQPMLWDDLGPNDDPDVYRLPEQHDHYRAVIGLRRRFRALRLGGYRTLLADDARRLLVFERTLGDERLVIALNAGEHETSFHPSETDPDASWTSAFGGDEGPIPAVSGRVWTT